MYCGSGAKRKNEVMNIFISDLDKTLVYSSAKDQCCVEQDKDGRKITYMTQEGIQTMERLIARDDFKFIPCTLRSIEQTSRIIFTKNCSHIICDNGGSIYINGIVDEAWDAIVSAHINRKEISLIAENIKAALIEKGEKFYRIKTNRDCFVSTIFYSSTDTMRNLDLMKKYIPEGYTIHNQGKKLYIVPNWLDKKNAAEYIVNKLKPSNIFTAGDSSVDKNFVDVGTQVFLPAHSTFKKEHAITTKSDGVIAGEEILKNIELFIS